MQLRKLERKDALFMLEWMHDETVVRDLHADFLHKTIEDCYRFIEIANGSSDSVHLAVVDDNDEYMGTVSLKNINNRSAEFAIVMRSKAIGKGYSRCAMERILEIGTVEMNLTLIYWCVSPGNKRAIRFYDKNGYKRISTDSLSSVKGYTLEEIQKLFWYAIKG